MTIALLGAGMLGESLLRGLLAAGHPPDAVVVAEKHPPAANAVRERYAVRVAGPIEAVAGAEVVLVAVKPPDVPALLGEIGPALAGGTVVVSLAAGVTLATLEGALPPGTAVVRVMSNTPVRVREAMSALSAGAHTSEELLARAERVLAAVGRTVRVPEAQQDAVTALSGSGPAYVFLMVEALIDAGVLLGLPRAVATELVEQTVYGSAALLRDSEQSAAALREGVTSPGGTTIHGLRALDDGGVRAAIYAAVEAAHRRSRELGRG
ncbi:MAG TPA: pyrroline-5-carboxylate reductase [Mycobacteriales bacterium]|nr:pyrroline-5-carboxylate reductase [Mycobacteriales bacterium]